jgi:hypothetical protein
MPPATSADGTDHPNLVMPGDKPSARGSYATALVDLPIQPPTAQKMGSPLGGYKMLSPFHPPG